MTTVAMATMKNNNVLNIISYKCDHAGSIGKHYFDNCEKIKIKYLRPPKKKTKKKKKKTNKQTNKQKKTKKKHSSIINTLEKINKQIGRARL